MGASVRAIALLLVPFIAQGWIILPFTTRLPFSCSQKSTQSPVFSTGTTRSSQRTTRLSASPILDSSIVLGQESWRQYVPLAVSLLVIVDILLGSPILNLIVAPMKRQAEGDDEQQGMFASTHQQQPRVNPKERIDSEQVAQEALDRARNSMELREYLDAQKTDWDRMEEMRKKMDQQMADVDEVLEQRREQE